NELALVGEDEQRKLHGLRRREREPNGRRREREGLWPGGQRQLLCDGGCAGLDRGLDGGAIAALAVAVVRGVPLDELEPPLVGARRHKATTVHVAAHRRDGVRS